MYYDIEDPSDCVSEYQTEIGASQILIMVFVSIFPLIGMKRLFFL